MRTDPIQTVKPHFSVIDYAFALWDELSWSFILLTLTLTLTLAFTLS